MDLSRIQRKKLNLFIHFAKLNIIFILNLFTYINKNIL